MTAIVPMMNDAPHAQLCGAKTRNGTPCQHYPVTGRNRCHLHGGKSLVGAAQPAFKHGRNSKYLPTRLLARYTESLRDPEYLSAQDDIAVLDARIAELFGRIDSGESGRTWRSLAESWTTYETADAEGDDLAKRRALQQVGKLIARGLPDWAIWDEIYRAYEQRGRAADRERKRLMDMRQMVTSEQMLLFVTALADSVRRHVTDGDAVLAIQQDILRLTGSGT